MKLEIQDHEDNRERELCCPINIVKYFNSQKPHFYTLELVDFCEKKMHSGKDRTEVEVEIKRIKNLSLNPLQILRNKILFTQ